MKVKRLISVLLLTLCVFFVNNSGVSAENLTVQDSNTAPLCFTAEGGGVTVKFNIRSGMHTIQYSTNGSSWSTYTSNSDVNLSVGEKVYFRAESNQTANTAQAFSNQDGELLKSTFVFTSTSNGKVSASGNIMSLYGPDCPNLKLPVLAFAYLFEGCSLLTAAPALPATSLSSSCYSCMFMGCSSLTVAPALPALQFDSDAYGCYLAMFSECSSMTEAPALPATVLCEDCYNQMFENCTSLKTLPELPARTLQKRCYRDMFKGCTSLVVNTEGPGVEWGINVDSPYFLEDDCVTDMFADTRGTMNGTPDLNTPYYVASAARALNFVGGASDNNWNTKQNWSPQYVPTSIDEVTISAACTINTSDATCNNLKIENGGSLTINADAVLDVRETLTNSVATNLTLKAAENSSATLLFAAGSPSATVESYIKGGLHRDGKGANHPDWQYRGFVGNNLRLDEWNVVIFKWSEETNDTTCWGDNPVYEKNGSWFGGSPWNGYSMANYGGSTHIYSYTATLIPTNSGHTYNLSYTNNGETPNRGMNLITNSWTAPIDMSSNAVSFSGNVEHSFIFFKTRNYQTWQNDPTNSFVTYPQNTGETVYGNSLIPSSQSFFVKASGTGASLTVNDGALACQNSGTMYAPREKEHFNLLSLSISVDSAKDYLFLLESERCTSAFDNGYDGSKIKEDNNLQIFCSNAFGATAVNADRSILGQKIGYSAPVDGILCTISFDAERLEGYSELYLYDRVLQRYTDILSGKSYTFVGRKTEEPERFEIVGSKDGETHFVTSSDRMVEVVGNYALLSGFDNENEIIYITDMCGRRMWSESSGNGPRFVLPGLPAGVYTIFCGDVNCKFIIK